MQHLDLNVDSAINRLKNAVDSREIKYGVFNSGVDIYKTLSIKNVSITKNTELLYTNTWSVINMFIDYTTVQQKVYAPDNIRYKMDLVIFPALDDNKFPEMLEIKMFGAYGKPAAVAIDREDGNIYLLYIIDSQLVLLHFAQLNSVDKEFIVSNKSVVTYEFGIDRKSLYAFITREYGWENLRNNMFVRFNTSPFVRVSVGSKE